MSNAMRSIQSVFDTESAPKLFKDVSAERVKRLANAIANLRFPMGTLPAWVQDELDDRELFWLASAMTAFYDEGI